MSAHGSSIAVPAPGELVRVRSRVWLVDEVFGPAEPGASHLVRLVGADEDNAVKRHPDLRDKATFIFTHLSRAGWRRVMDQERRLRACSRSRGR